MNKCDMSYEMTNQQIWDEVEDIVLELTDLEPTKKREETLRYDDLTYAMGGELNF